MNYNLEEHRWQIGIETSSQQDQRDRYLNLKGIEGAQSFSQLESFRNLGIYILDEVQWENLLLRTSLRYDDLSLGADSVFEDQKYQVLNPSIGLSYEIDLKQRIFVNFSSSFETPTLSELSSNPSGEEGLNLELNPSRALNYELGWKGLWAKTRIEANLFFNQFGDSETLIFSNTIPQYLLVKFSSSTSILIFLVLFSTWKLLTDGVFRSKLNPL